MVAADAWVAGADEVCWVQPATARKRRAGRRVARGFIRGFAIRGGIRILIKVTQSVCYVA
jgi:hypothetical protein